MADKDTGRVNKKGGRHYRKPVRPDNPALNLMQLPLRLHTALFPTADTDAPSVTTILGVLAKPALIGWAAKEERKMVARLAGQLYEQLGKTLEEPIAGQKFADMLSEEAGKPANRRLLEIASNVGTQVHARIEWELKGELGLERKDEAPPLLSVQATRSFTRWVEWRQQVKLKPIAMEKRIHSSVFGFGGTLDLLAEIAIPPVEPNLIWTPVLVVIDFKTGKAVYAEAFLQNVAYRIALAEEGINAPRGIIVRLPKNEEDPEFDAVEVPKDDSLALTFLALRLVFPWFVENHGQKKKVEKVISTEAER